MNQARSETPPQMRGKACDLDVTARWSGSPPHVRGKVAQFVTHILCHGITPACAGKSFIHLPVDLRNRDHPRVCGEKAALILLLAAVAGSPPRVRGKENGPGDCGLYRGITPACAGKRPRLQTATQSPQDHPRVCGEKTLSIAKVDGGTGSPPRVRGKVRLDDTGCLRYGITPACAGKRLPFLLVRLLPEDHPRVCGEKRVRAGGDGLSQGSPPRVRGKVIVAMYFPIPLRITPACAGKSLCKGSLAKQAGDHPACAGKSLSETHSAKTCKDHPRVCGEKRAMRPSLPMP